MASTSMSDTSAERTHIPTPEGSARAGVKLHEFFKHLEGKSRSHPSEGADRGRVSRFRGLLSGELEDVDFKIMDEDTKRDVKRFVKRRHWDGSWKTLRGYLRKWEFYLGYWGKILRPELKALTFLTSLPDEYAEFYLKLMYELKWTYQDMHEELLDEARECADDNVVEDEWEDHTPPAGNYRSYRKWYLQWGVLLQRVGQVMAAHAKKILMRALTRSGFFNDLIAELLEAEVEDLREFN